MNAKKKILPLVGALVAALITSGVVWAQYGYPPIATVPPTRTLTTTSPITCDGTTSCNLSANRTLACPTCVVTTADTTFVKEVNRSISVAASTTVSTAGATLGLSAATGSPATGAAAGGQGGATTIQGGAGGDGSSTKAAGAGGWLYLYGGPAGTAGAGGGGHGLGVSVQGGLPSGTGTKGTVLVGTDATRSLSVTLGHSAGGVGLSAPTYLNPIGAGAGATGELRFLELIATGSNYIGFKAPDALTGDRIWTLPSADGSAGNALITSGAGVLSWTAPGGDLAGTLASATVGGLQGRVVSNAAPAAGEVLTWSAGGGGSWGPNTPATTYGRPATSGCRWPGPANVAAGDLVTITLAGGTSKVYEFDGAGANVNVVRGANLGASIDNLVTAIQAQQTDCTPMKDNDGVGTGCTLWVFVSSSALVAAGSTITLASTSVGAVVYHPVLPVAARPVRIEVYRWVVTLSDAARGHVAFLTTFAAVTGYQMTITTSATNETIVIQDAEVVLPILPIVLVGAGAAPLVANNVINLTLMGY